ncbi:MAG: DUF29 family protein [Cardiobacteriaceae bacterium]|nr:DUF29 family protein [Cardiobacteriaceae bacterium]
MNEPIHREVYVDVMQGNGSSTTAEGYNSMTQEQLAHITYQSVVRSKHQEFEETLSLLIMELLKWRYLKERRANSVKRMIKKHRIKIPEMLESFPTLETYLFDQIWLERVWKASVMLMEHITHFKNFFPEKPVWTIGEIIDMHFFPE